MSTKKLQILDSLILEAKNADTVDGKHADEFALASDVSTLQELVGDESVSTQITNAVSPVSTVANAAMPKSGGTFTGNVVANDTNRAGRYIRGNEVKDSAGTTQVSTNCIVFVRK